MTGPEHLSLSLTSLLNDLAESLPASDPQDAHATRGLKKKFGKLQNTLDKESTPYLADFCGVAARLVEELSVSGLVGPKETMDIVGEIVATVREALGMARQEVRIEGSTAPQGVPLRLIEGQRIGELLVTLSMLTPDDVERALRLQRMNGLLLGEALVEQGVLTREAVQAAVRLQTSRRQREGGSPVDPWRGSQAS
jgi:hypothetical protein